ncbi:hypothetical protein [Novosphingobium sp. 9U]|uniref:hypothetical protein n=1 Tax=Novosphingobium sp. 9U TaxID=2653158 RepID=UPI0012F32FDD|nr:hypothetical protein [Novosphingobium sp. 9U]VWX53929.1 conserved hypothetical protein [Novosphingobium sp. 9U]
MPTIISTTNSGGKRIPLTKTLTWTENAWSKSDYSNAYLFNSDRYPARSIDELSVLLQVLETMPYHAIIRGRLVDGRDDVAVRRTLHSFINPEGNFEPSPNGLRWLMLDIDKLPVSSYGFTGMEERLAHLISTLPPEFQQATFHFQWSSSAGLDGWGTLSCHLWFFLTEPWLCGDLHDRLQSGDWKHYDIDPAPFTPNQIHYTASPIFVGAQDPLGCDRSGLVRGQVDAVTISPWVRPVEPRPVFTPAEREERFPGCGFEDLLADIGPSYHRPILRAVAHYVAVTAEPDVDWLTERLVDTIWAAHHGKNRKQDYVDPRYLDRVISGALAKFRRIV